MKDVTGMVVLDEPVWIPVKNCICGDFVHIPNKEISNITLGGGGTDCLNCGREFVFEIRVFEIVKETKDEV
jgi:hypothetical protein